MVWADTRYDFVVRSRRHPVVGDIPEESVVEEGRNVYREVAHHDIARGAVVGPGDSDFGLQADNIPDPSHNESIDGECRVCNNRAPFSVRAARHGEGSFPRRIVGAGGARSAKVVAQSSPSKEGVAAEGRLVEERLSASRRLIGTTSLRSFSLGEPRTKSQDAPLTGPVLTFPEATPMLTLPRLGGLP